MLLRQKCKLDIVREIRMNFCCIVVDVLMECFINILIKQVLFQWQKYSINVLNESFFGVNNKDWVTFKRDENWVTMDVLDMSWKEQGNSFRQSRFYTVIIINSYRTCTYVFIVHIQQQQSQNCNTNHNIFAQNLCAFLLTK
eukprot:TRINITY_DN1915_c0_g1_i4.p3 TRINITY_DN1915_c0_g1~~TRINITY_DN1915_c0_g1_i4.p3  ORF type:complete len:141 (-),score=2.61 TRINITY_DN1915_c0_g1_i4:59-481(-)